MRFPVLSLALASLALPLAAQGPTVHVVDQNNGPGTDFTDLQLAVNAAAEGDFLVVRNGDYFAKVVGKTLAIQGLTPGGAGLTLNIQSLQLGQYVAVRGCRVDGTQSNNAGTVFVEDANLGGYGWSEFAANDCDDVILRSVYAGFGWAPCEGALYFSSASLFVYDSKIYGNTPSSGLGQPGCDSEPAITLYGLSQLYLHGSHVEGGWEGTSWGTLFCARPGIVSASSPVELTDSVVLGGRNSTCAGQPAGVKGVTPRRKAGTARRIVSPSPVFEGQTTTVEYHGDPGDRVYLAGSPVPGPSTYYPQLGAYHGDRSRATVVPVGVIPASGVLVQTLTAPSFGPTETVHSFYLQGYFVAPSGERQLSAPTQVHLLDPNY